VIEAIEGGDASRGGHSWLERRFLVALADAGIALPATQAVLSKSGDRLVRVDCYFEGTSVVVELLGYRWHRTKSQMADDARRLNALQLDGYIVVQFTYDHVTTELDWVLDTTRRALTPFRAA
jgi:hypothetical protein